jgi:poly-gamma-glutamate synthesis protein (capsule biosynthesis protein)
MKILSFLGDIYLDKEYGIDFELDEYIFNLEYPISSRGTPAKDKINLIQSKSYIQETFGKYPIAVNLANNHIMDYGEEAFDDTIKFLEENSIKYFGAGNKTNNFNNPCILEFGKKTIALFGYSCETTSAVFGDESNNGSAFLDLEIIKTDLDNCDADFKIVQLHWGMEEIPYPTYKDTQKAHQIIDFGADMIIGHHAHIIQPVEEYKGKKIFYGIGNCIFPDFKMESHFDGEKFTRISKKKQLRHNKQSIKIDLKENLDVQFNVIELIENRLKSKNNYNFKYNVPKSENQFISQLIKTQRIIMLRNVFYNPKIPKIRHFKKLLGLSI